MKTPIHLLLGGSDSTNGDVSLLPPLAKANKTCRWSSHKDARKGDRVLIYIQSPNSAIVASAIVVKNAKKGKYWPYEASIGEIQMLRNPVTLAEMREMFPDWKWAKFARGKTHLQEPIASQLWKRAHLNGKTVSEITSKNGAGFGTPETNWKVEKAGVRVATKDLKSHGFKVISREVEKIGYDLEATKGKVTLHVEVKGVAGKEPAFVITAGERRRAAIDADFYLYVVTEVLSKQPRLHKFTGSELSKAFGFKPLSYMAKRK